MNLQLDKATQFRQLHRGPGILILPNAWDVASARVFEEAGFPALATTSAGIAFSLGYPDGQKIPREEMLARIGRIARAMHVPLTADVESGYGSTPEDAAQTSRELVQAGVVGMNIEDASDRRDQPLIDLHLAVEKIKAVREAAMQMGSQIVVNARTDVYLLPGGNPDADYSEALRRLIAFRDAGADCVFAPGLKDPETIERLVKAVGCPLNILAVPGAPVDSGTGEIGSGTCECWVGPDARHARTAGASGGGVEDYWHLRHDDGRDALCRC